MQQAKVHGKLMNDDNLEDKFKENNHIEVVLQQLVQIGYQNWYQVWVFQLAQLGGRWCLYLVVVGDHVQVMEDNYKSKESRSRFGKIGS